MLKKFSSLGPRKPRRQPGAPRAVTQSGYSCCLRASYPLSCAGLPSADVTKTGTLSGPGR